MMKISKPIIGVIILAILATPLFATIPGDLRVYIGIGPNDKTSFYLCVNAKNPEYATETIKFNPENICFYYDKGHHIWTRYTTDRYGNHSFRVLDLPLYYGASIEHPIAMFEYLASKNIIKAIFYDTILYDPVYGVSFFGLYEPQFVESTPTGYIKLLFSDKGTHTIRYLAVSKAIGPEPFIFYGRLLSKEEVANEPPFVEIINPKPGTMLIHTDVVNLEFRATDPENKTMICYYYVGNIENAISVLSGEKVSIALKIDYIGNVSISVICKDPYGLTGQASTYVIRELPPSASIIYPYTDDLVTTSELSVSYMVADNGEYIVCNLSIVGTNVSKEINITLPESGVAFKRTTLDLSELSDGAYYTLKLVCTDSVGLQTQSQVTFEYALDPDRSERWCTSPEINGEWYGDHCCGDDPGEHLSTDAKGYPTPQAFDPTTCSIIELDLGQCDDDSDCPPGGWFCASETVRELRTYKCVKDVGEIVGSCQEVVIDTQDCSAIDPSYICSNGICTPAETPNQPPTITILYPEKDQVINVTIYKKQIQVKFKVSDDNSVAVLCNLTLNDNIINLGVLNVSETYTYNVTGVVNGTNTLSITCLDSYNATSTASITFTVNIVPAECIVDSDCGIDGWQCVSSTERAYIDYICDAGKCIANITKVETAPSGHICIDGRFVSETTLECSSDADCPPDDRICTQDKTGYIIRDWYCDLSTGTCKYEITKTVSCGENQYCIAGVCWDKGETACEGLIITYCISETEYIELVAVYKEDLETCVYIPVGTFTCPAGTVCFAGKCSSEPTANLPPVINYNITPRKVKVGDTVTISVEVSDDNTPVLFVNVTAQIPELIQIYKGIVAAGKTITAYYIPPHASTHIISISAIDQYGVETTVQDTIEVEEKEEAPPGPPAGAPTAPTGPAGAAAPTAAAIAKAPTAPIWLIIIVVIIIVGILAYFFLRR